jgi:putative flippase GtrA
MIALVQSGLLEPVPATAVGATVGGLFNFMLARAWIFPEHSGSVAGQASRYAAVSAGSAALNVLGEHLVHQRAHVQYVIARSLVAVAVSLLWNYPLHRRFVFGASER